MKVTTDKENLPKVSPYLQAGSPISCFLAAANHFSGAASMPTTATSIVRMNAPTRGRKLTSLEWSS